MCLCCVCPTVCVCALICVCVICVCVCVCPVCDSLDGEKVVISLLLIIMSADLDRLTHCLLTTTNKQENLPLITCLSVFH